MVRTLNVAFVSSCSPGHSGACLVSKVFVVVELLLFSLVCLVSVYYMLLYAGSVLSSRTNIEPVWFVGPTTGTGCMSMFVICSYFRILLVVHVMCSSRKQVRVTNTPLHPTFI